MKKHIRSTSEQIQDCLRSSLLWQQTTVEAPAPNMPLYFANCALRHLSLAMPGEVSQELREAVLNRVSFLSK